MATYYRTGVETYSIIGTADERGSLEGRIPDGSTYFAVDENMFYTFYDGQWYETLPEAARLYHDDVGTDTKPIKLVGGVATVVANELAEDSKVVHLAGDEIITGVKVFTNPINLYRADPTLNFKSTSTSAQTGVKANIVFYTDGAVRGQVFQQRDATSEFVALRQQKLVGSGFSELRLRVDSNDVGWAECPAYTADNSADNKIVNRSMLAQTPTVVHTTGNESIAGTKTFAAIKMNGNIQYRQASKTLSSGQWARFYTYTPSNDNGGAELRFWNSYYTLDYARMFARFRGGTSTNPPSAKIFGTTTNLSIKFARRASDNKIEVWMGNTSGSTKALQVNVVEMYAITLEVDVSSAADQAPVVGDEYTEITDAEVVP